MSNVKAPPTKQKYLSPVISECERFENLIGFLDVLIQIDLAINQQVQNNSF